jgi:AcrR family transcriptional regulator
VSIASNRREREKAQRREDILQAAREVFMNGSPFRGTIDDVAARAEVSKGTVYLYFESKEVILALLLLEGLETLRVRFEKAYAPHRILPASRCLERLGSAYFQFCREFPSYFRLMIAFDRGRFRESIPNDLYNQVFESSKGILEFVAQVIQQGIEDDEFQSVDPWHTTGVLWASLNGVLLLTDHPLRRELIDMPVETMFQQTLDILLNGIRKANE